LRKELLLHYSEANIVLGDVEGLREIREHLKGLKKETLVSGLKEELKNYKTPAQKEAAKAEVRIAKAEAGQREAEARAEEEVQKRKDVERKLAEEKKRNRESAGETSESTHRKSSMTP
jgi:hypothetical protein